MKILKRVRCLFNGGHQFKFRNNIRDGDRALVMGARSVWVCPQCEAVEYRKEVHEEAEVPAPWFQRSTPMSCPDCCAKAGEPHLPSCPENQTKGSSNAK